MSARRAVRFEGVDLVLKRISQRIKFKGGLSLEEPDLVVLGLGNPGAEYSETRHNAGANAVRRFVSAHKARLRRVGKRASAARILIPRTDEEGHERPVDVVAAVPLTFMNESGIAASWLLRNCNVPVDRLMVVHDDIDLPMGTVRLKFGGGSGGHRGVESVIKALGSNAFQRVRIGVGRPPEGADVVDYVLAPFDPDEREEAERAIASAVEAIEVAAARGIEAAMNLYN